MDIFNRNYVTQGFQGGYSPLDYTQDDTTNYDSYDDALYSKMARIPSLQVQQDLKKALEE